MSNTNIKLRGFTIVELLIVIVVIAILATISIVAYNGIQSRGKTSAGQSLQSQIAKKVEAYNTVDSNYPTFAQLTATTSTVPEAQLDNTSAVVNYVAGTGAGQVGNAGTYANGQKVVFRERTGGGCVWTWDFANNVSMLKTLGTSVAGSTAGTGCTQ